MANLAARLMRALDGIVLRPETDADLPFLVALYASVRADELAPVPWPAEAKLQFLADQFRLQREHYYRHYDGAEFLLIETHGQAIGRVYLYRSAGEIRLMEISLAAGQRGTGIGSRLLRALLGIAAADGCEVTLHVEPNNRARHLYERFGFSVRETRGVNLYMTWAAASEIVS